MILISGHGQIIGNGYIEANASNLIEFLNVKKVSIIQVIHSMDPKIDSLINYYVEGKLIKTEKLVIPIKFVPFRYLFEILRTVSFFLSVKNKEAINYFIGIDPLNAFIGILLKKMKVVKKTIFHTPDYSEKRFENNLLDKIYHFVDFYSAKKSDCVWNVSKKILEVRVRQGVAKKKLFVVSNIPCLVSDFVELKKNKFILITLGQLSEQLDFDNLFIAIKDVSKKYPVKLIIVGDGPKKQELIDKTKSMKINHLVKFVGRKPHEKALKLISNSGIGLALYTKNWAFNLYGDSAKCREFFAFGLPIVTTKNHATIDDIIKYSPGMVCEMDSKEYANAIIKILKNYSFYSKKSFLLHKKRFVEKKEIIDKLCLT